MDGHIIDYPGRREYHQGKREGIQQGIERGLQQGIKIGAENERKRILELLVASGLLSKKQIKELFD